MSSVSSSKEDYLEIGLMKYYQKKENITILAELLKDKPKISLRLIDWFITKHAKTESINYELNGESFYVYSQYKNQLKAFAKKNFDPFCRSSQKIVIKSNNISITSTCGQLNFFRWAIDNKLIKYIIDNIKEIETKVKKFNKNRKREKKEELEYIKGLEEQITPIDSNCETIRNIARKIQLNSIVSFD